MCTAISGLRPNTYVISPCCINDWFTVQVYAFGKCYMLDTSNDGPRLWQVLKSMLEEQGHRIFIHNARQLVGLLDDKDVKLQSVWHLEVIVDTLCSSIHKQAGYMQGEVCVKSPLATCA